MRIAGLGIVMEHLEKSSTELTGAECRYLCNPRIFPTESKHKEYQSWAAIIFGKETPKTKVAIFAKPEIELEKLDWSNEFTDHSVKHFLPCRINREFNLLAVWTHRNNSPNFGYMGQFWKYLQVNRGKMKNILKLIGDFNSNNLIWDQWDRWWNHSDVVNELTKSWN